MDVTDDQLRFERAHLAAKLAVRSPGLLAALPNSRTPIRSSGSSRARGGMGATLNMAGGLRSGWIGGRRFVSAPVRP
ncbi:hypothetical protein [Tessaracoccus coleopterorum]|uniref:hypothetical protein n=1 Tax=Tessaracoccus coleopterorum TaxID=2714950 RepID=UPI0018D32BFE|nr:hypothetical protein [Tessaracoccus coleopterorum]